MQECKNEKDTFITIGVLRVIKSLKLGSELEVGTLLRKPLLRYEMIKFSYLVSTSISDVRMRDILK